MAKTKKLIAAHCKKLTALALSAFLMLAMTVPAYASGGVGGSKIVTGTEKLIGDITTWLMVLAPVVAGLLIIYFCIRRSAADEMDTKKWNNRIVVAIVSCIGAILGSATLNLIIGYYK
jgi:ABC-type molybdate transport system permease subunit